MYEHNMENAYIGEFKGYIPTKDTIIYFPFKKDLYDDTGDYLLSSYNGAQIGTLGGVKCLDLSASNSYCDITLDTLPQGGHERTNMAWVRWKYKGKYPIYTYGTSGNGQVDCIWRNDNENGAYGNPAGIAWSNYGDNMATGTAVNANTRYHVAITISSGNVCKLYVNGQLKNTVSSWPKGINTQGYWLRIGLSDDGSINGYISDFIVENKALSESEILAYYNRTSSQY